jgi:hypothetical protein
MNRKKAEALYRKYMAMAFDCQTKMDRVLFESYYQQAEYYLHLMNNPDEALQAFRSTVRKTAPEKRLTRHHNFKTTSGAQTFHERPDVHMKESASPKRGETAVPFRGSFLRRNRHALHPYKDEGFKEE